MTVRAKFKVDAIERTTGYKPTLDPEAPASAPKYNYVPAEMWTIKMSPVYGNGDPNHENTKFWQATPSGSLTLGSINKDAVAEFDLGSEYYIDFTPVGQ
jgi:hypothetical protein